MYPLCIIIIFFSNAYQMYFAIHMVNGFAKHPPSEASDMIHLNTFQRSYSYSITMLVNDPAENTMIISPQIHRI